MILEELRWVVGLLTSRLGGGRKRRADFGFTLTSSGSLTICVNFDMLACLLASRLNGKEGGGKIKMKCNKKTKN